MNKKIKTTEFENVYYYMGWYIFIDEKRKIYYISQKAAVGGYDGSKEFVLDLAVKYIDKTEQDRGNLYENIEHKLCNLVKTDLARMVYNSIEN